MLTEILAQQGSSMPGLADFPELVGFFSYSREDDEDSNGALSELPGRIQRELRGQLGRSIKTFRLWQDKEAIPSGALWEDTIKAAVSQSVFFIPIVTPTAVRSPYCKSQLESFLAREAELERSDLVFPILYIRVPGLEDAAQKRSDPVLKIIGERQYPDWRKLRLRDVNSTEVKSAVERFCAHICEALDRPWIPPDERRRQQEAEARHRAEEERVGREAEVKRRKEEARQKVAAEERRRSEEAQARQRAEEERERREAENRRREEEAHQRAAAEAEARSQREAEYQRRKSEFEAERHRKLEQDSRAAPHTANLFKIPLVEESLFLHYISMLRFIVLLILASVGTFAIAMFLPPPFTIDDHPILLYLIFGVSWIFISLFYNLLRLSVEKVVKHRKKVSGSKDLAT